MGEIGGMGMRGVGERNRKAEKDVIIFYLKLKINLYNVLKEKVIHRPTSNNNLFCHFISNIISGL